MADNDIGTATRASGNGKGTTSAARSRSASRRSARSSNASEAEMKKQIAELKREVSRLNRMLSDQAEEAAHGWYQSAADRASSLYSGASHGASRAAKQLRTQAHSVSETVQQNPGTISTAVAIGGLFGVLMGLTIARSSQPDPDWFRRWQR
ncbi:hypothetical protein RFN29_11775 [Mesorhizobium sp. VK22B]|uniref:DUF883 domain-containing protein n=1 Tax=Mesorhizobium captivum TaxID=3072319 RepID=A0ABU4YZY8_9HYPH|nr:hypothetical protein [Mesorhizobium sp. VK22B]MDX8492261.1 hypothetical protein [Mesorhizobium sp. VK22B]